MLIPALIITNLLVTAWSNTCKYKIRLKGKLEPWHVQPNIQAFYKPLLTVFTDSAAFRVEHAAVTLCMSTGVNQAPLLPFVIGHVTQGTAVRHLLLHAQVTQDVNVWKKQRQRLKFSVSGGTSSSYGWCPFFVQSRTKLFLVQSSEVKVCNTEQAEKIQTKQKRSNSSQFFFIHIAFLHFSIGINTSFQHMLRHLLHRPWNWREKKTWSLSFHLIV